MIETTTEQIRGMKDQVKGLVVRLESLETDDRIFTKVQGVQTEIEKGRAELNILESELEDTKENIAGLKEQKEKVTRHIAIEVQDRMDEVLPYGHSVIAIEDGAVDIMWQIPEGNEAGDVRMVNHTALSGGESVVFHSALAHALGGEILVIEGAEVDSGRLVEMLAQLSDIDDQVIMSTWAEPVTELGEWQGVWLNEDGTEVQG